MVLPEDTAGDPPGLLRSIVAASGFVSHKMHPAMHLQISEQMPLNVSVVWTETTKQLPLEDAIAI